MFILPSSTLNPRLYGDGTNNTLLKSIKALAYYLIHPKIRNVGKAFLISKKDEISI